MDSTTSKRWVLASLIVLTLAARGAMSMQREAISPDGVLYLESARQILDGNPQPTFDRFGLNVYPWILAAIHRLGMPWEDAARVWGVLVGTLTVWPVYGLTLRWFGRRIAVTAGFLYAVHPKFIEWSSDAVRDPTFWCLTALTLYAGWTAAETRRWRWFAATGALWTLAVHTRFEGWLLLVPLAVWWTAAGLGKLSSPIDGGASSVQEAASIRERPRYWVWVGVLTAACVYPACWLGVGWVMGPNAQRAAMHDFYRLSFIQQFVDSMSPPTQKPVEVGAAAPARKVDAPVATTVEGAVFAVSKVEEFTLADGGKLLKSALERGFGPVFGVLWVLGIVLRRRRWLMIDQWPLLVVGLGVTAAMWFHLWVGKASSSRYALTIVLLGIPTAACAARDVVDGCRSVFGRMFDECWGTAAAKLCWGVIAVVGVGDALSGGVKQNETEAALGRWILGQYGSGSCVWSTEPCPVLLHYAEAAADATSAKPREPNLVLYPPINADFVLVTDRLPTDARRRALAAAEGAGFRVVPGEQLPAECSARAWTVMRREVDARTARRLGSGSK